MTAQRKGHNASVAMNASGKFNQTKCKTGFLRLSQAGVVVADGASLVVEAFAD